MYLCSHIPGRIYTPSVTDTNEQPTQDGGGGDGKYTSDQVSVPVEEQFKSICWEFQLKYKILLTNTSSTRPNIALDSNTCPLDKISAVRA